MKRNLIFWSFILCIASSSMPLQALPHAVPNIWSRLVETSRESLDAFKPTLLEHALLAYMQHKNSSAAPGHSWKEHATLMGLRHLKGISNGLNKLTSHLMVHKKLPKAKWPCLTQILTGSYQTTLTSYRPKLVEFMAEENSSREFSRSLLPTVCSHARTYICQDIAQTVLTELSERLLLQPASEKLCNFSGKTINIDPIDLLPNSLSQPLHLMMKGRLIVLLALQGAVLYEIYCLEQRIHSDPQAEKITLNKTDFPCMHFYERIK